MIEKYLLSGIPWQSPDPAASAADPAAATTATEQPAATPDPAPQPQPTGERTPWFLGRIAEEQNKRREFETRAAEAERRARDAEEMLARLQRQPPAADPARPAAPAQPQPQQQPATQADFDTQVQRAASKQRLYEDSLAIKTAGMSQFGAAFAETLTVLNAVGAVSDDFVSDVLAVDRANAHVLLNSLAKDPEKAVLLAGMNSRQRTAELTRMSIAMTAPTAAAATTTAPAVDPAKPKAVSAAPAPRPPVEASAGPAVQDWREIEDEATWSKKWDEQYLGRKSA